MKDMGSRPRRRTPGWAMSLPLPLLLAARYLKSSRRDAYVSLLSLLACGGIALGVAALVLVLAGLAGLQSFLRSDVLARTPHLEVELPPGTDAEAVRLSLIQQVPDLEEARILIRGRAWLLIGGGTTDVRVVGYTDEVPSFFPLSEGAAFEAASSEEDLDKEGIYVSETFFQRWGLRQGSKVELVSPRPTLTPMGPRPRWLAQTVVGTFVPGRTEQQEERVAVPLKVAKRLFGSRLQRIELKAEDLESALDLVAPVTALLPEGSRVLTWQDLNRGLFFALKLEKRLMFVSVFLIVPVAAMALITVLGLLLSAKRQEIGMLHALGAGPTEIRRAFAALGMTLAMSGLLAGGTLGMLGAWALDHFKLIAPPGDVYFLDHVPFVIQVSDLAAVTVATLAFTAASTFYAARRAAAAGPLEALNTI